TFSGRTFTEEEVELMRVVAHDYAGLGVTEIARTVCELLEWKRWAEESRVPPTHGASASRRRAAASGPAEVGRNRAAARRRIQTMRPAGISGVRSQRLRTTGVGPGRRPTGEPFVARAVGTLSLFRLPCAVRCAIA